MGSQHGSKQRYEKKEAKDPSADHEALVGQGPSAKDLSRGREFDLLNVSCRLLGHGVFTQPGCGDPGTR